MYESGKTAQITREFKQYGLDILGISETRWTEFGEVNVSTGEQIIYSGHQEENAPHMEGVALMLSVKARRALIRWDPINSRLMTATFRTQMKGVNLNIIKCYAPTNTAPEQAKEIFYLNLQNTFSKLRKKDITIVMGDLNAKIGSNNTGLDEVMGTHGLGVMNENGTLFTDWCADNNMVIGGSIFPHKEIHKATWISPDNRTENQIDHFCISKLFRTSLQDVRVFRGADVGTGHHLVMAKIKLKLKARKRPQASRSKYNVAHLESTQIRGEFEIEVQNRFEPLQHLSQEISIEEEWNMLKQGLLESCQKVLGRKTKEHKPWITPETLLKIDERKRAKEAVNIAKTRNAKARTQTRYNDAHREVRKCIKEDKRKYFEGLAQEAEAAAGSGNMRDLYQTTRKMAGKYQQCDKPIKDKNGKLLTNKEEQKARWKEHFSDLLNRPIATNPPTIEAAETDLPIDCDPPTELEILKAIKEIKLGKAAGPDGIPGEAIKFTPNTSVKPLSHLFRRVWESEEFPGDWKDGHIVKLPKKGNLQDCGNHRGIMLLSIPGKIFNRIILNRIQDAVDLLLRDEQAGFRKGRSCTDQISTLRIIVEQSQEWNSPLYINFIDFEKAFDSVDRPCLWKLLRHHGIPQKITELIRKMYDGVKASVIHAGELTEHFDITTGVRQGCLLSPFLFLLAINWIMKTATSERRNGIQWTLTEQLEDLDFADDIALLSHSRAQMQAKTDSIVSNSQQLGLKINDSKTKVLRNQPTDSNADIMLRGKMLENVDKFCYLGSIIDNQGGVDEDIKTRIQKARQAFGALNKIWKSQILREKTKLRIFNSNVKSVLFYGSETWRLTKGSTGKLQVFINKCLRRILRISWTDMISNSQLQNRTHQVPVETELRKRKWRWIGHTLRKPPDSITRRSLTWNPQGARSRGRPKCTWRREVEAEMKRAQITWKELENKAQDRRSWRLFVEDLCSTGS